MCTNRFLSGYSSDAWSIASRRNLQRLWQLLLSRLL
ncbi:unnamed protein product [Aureobasidium mustum]|uniref:Uncharacterized protein n=1 Tax=Aureobasidium mustum TaxID=2773714 RepID=A0A9N8JNI2_9PEZI|nr:unnamed protein product [Aureobasidium mustum]